MGLTRSQPPVDIAVEVKETTAPLQLIETVWLGGAFPPAGTAKVRDATPSNRLVVTGGGPAAGLTSRLTVTVQLPAHDAGVTMEM